MAEAPELTLKLLKLGMTYIQWYMPNLFSWQQMTYTQ